MSDENNEYPFVSVIVPVRNEEKNIENCLKALSKLDYPKDRYEIIVSDGCSTDGTQEIARRYGARVLHNEGRSRATGVNVGVEHSSGDYIAFTDADCVVDRSWLLNSLNYFEDDEVAGVGGPNIVPPTVSPFTRAIEYVTLQTPGAIKFEKKETVRSLAGCNSIYRAKLLKTFFPLPQIGYVEDTLLNYRIRKAGFKLVSAPDAIVWHNRHYTNYEQFFKQIFLYGKGEAQAKRIHREMYSAARILEIFSLPIALTFAVALYFINRPTFLAIISLGVLLLLSLSVKCILETKSLAVALHVPMVTITEALGYSIGYIQESISPTKESKSDEGKISCSEGKAKHK